MSNPFLHFQSIFLTLLAYDKGVVSPLLFAMFVEDPELYLQNDVDSGLVMDDIVIMLLLFADYMAIIDKTPTEIQNH